MSIDEESPTLDYDQAREIALRILTARGRSCAELYDRLVAKGASSVTAQEVIDRFQEVSLLDDAELARHIVRSEQSDKGYGLRRVRQRLMMRGIPPEIAEEALTAVGDDGERERAVAAARQLKRKHHAQPAHVQWRRIRDALLRRGFAPTIVTEVVGQILSDIGDGNSYHS